MTMGGMNMGGMDGGMSHDGSHGPHGPDDGGHEARRRNGRHGGMDLNDITYDAYLANDRTLADPRSSASKRAAACGCASSMERRRRRSRSIPAG